MGRASSAKKVAKVARSSGGPRREQAKLGFPAAVGAVLLLGVVMVFWAQNENSAAEAEPPTLADHWHAAYGIYICDSFAPALRDVVPDSTGIHTHDDDVVHVHPFSSASSGERANWARYGETVGLQFDGASFTMPDGTRYDESSTCGEQPARVVMYEWPADDPDAEPVVHTDDFGSVHFHSDRLAFTLAVVPEGTEVPRPASIPTLDNLSDMPGGTGGESVPEGGETIDPTLIDPTQLPDDPAGEGGPDAPAPEGEATDPTATGEEPAPDTSSADEPAADSPAGDDPASDTPAP